MERACIENHVAILNEELVCALGCTEPIAVALAAAIARDVLGEEPTSMEVTCSGNIIKNVKSVTVPNSGGLRGIEAASVLGAVGGDSHRALEVLESVTPADVERTKELLAHKYCDVNLEEGVPNLYIRVVAKSDSHTACTTIVERHTNIAELTLDGVDVDPTPYGGVPKSADGEPVSDADRRELSLESVWEFCHEVDVELIRDKIQMQIDANTAISAEGLTNDWGARIGKTLLASRADDISTRARAAAAAGSDARMSGCAMPVCIVCGSGNQGITCTLPVVEYARELGLSHDDMLRYVALSDLTAVHVKRFIGELSAFCGAVSAACGAGGAICAMRGGSFEQYEATVVNTLANAGGIVCDGAKPSCAAKIATALDAAILGCDQALSSCDFQAGEGLVAESAEQTIRSMGYVGRVGMHPTDVEILNIMIGKTDVTADSYGC